MDKTKIIKMVICAVVVIVALSAAILGMLYLYSQDKIVEDNGVIPTTVEVGKGEAKMEVLVGRGTEDKYLGPMYDAVIYLYNANKEYLAEASINETGIATFTGIENGTYYAQLHSITEGYVMDETIYYFEVTDENKTFSQRIYCDQELYGTFVIVTKDDQEVPVAESKYKVTYIKADGTEEDVKEIKSNEKGQSGLTSLIYGKYLIRQIETAEGLEMYTETLEADITKDSTEAIKFFITNPAK